MQLDRFKQWTMNKNTCGCKSPLSYTLYLVNVAGGESRRLQQGSDRLDALVEEWGAQQLKSSSEKTSQWGCHVGNNYLSPNVICSNHIDKNNNSNSLHYICSSRQNLTNPYYAVLNKSVTAIHGFLFSVVYGFWYLQLFLVLKQISHNGAFTFCTSFHNCSIFGLGMFVLSVLYVFCQKGKKKKKVCRQKLQSDLRHGWRTFGEHNKIIFCILAVLFWYVSKINKSINKI